MVNWRVGHLRFHQEGWLGPAWGISERQRRRGRIRRCVRVSKSAWHRAGPDERGSDAQLQTGADDQDSARSPFRSHLVGGRIRSGQTKPGHLRGRSFLLVLTNPFKADKKHFSLKTTIERNHEKIRN